MKNYIKSVALASLLLGAIMFAQAQPQNRAKAPDSPHLRMGDHLGRLDLSEDQQSKIKTIHIALQKELLPLKNQLGEKQARMKSLTTADNVDMKAINKLIDETSAIMADVQKLQASSHQQVRKILTNDQRVLFDSAPQRMGMSRMSMRQRGRNGVRKGSPGSGNGAQIHH